MATSYGHRDFWIRRLLALSDAAALLLALLISQPFGKDVHLATHLLWGLLAVPLWIVLFKAYLPERVQGHKYYEGKDIGREKDLNERFEERKKDT